MIGEQPLADINCRDFLPTSPLLGLYLLFDNLWNSEISQFNDNYSQKNKIDEFKRYV